ncbi:PIN domain-containing protein [Streptomyces sp. TX20-6-3]|uniref:PIN domain-containing protein n=1 Tax=Streptomyces sp. TX20-6-3 TaxID=3028705 RepID=UPI0029A71AF0|nr:PIN domain-containing protein [Streptomyces sp. TX20-6-3]MDX2564176.1 PIN domain-containing protein [Streptomyces sp. TX20-6-3]
MTSSFLSSFAGMWRRPAIDYETGISEYLVVLDTNVLLELYRFTPDARNELINVLQRLKERLWVPHQVGREYYDRRVDAIQEHLALYSSVPKALEEAKGRAIQEINTFARRCSITQEDRNRLTVPIEEAFKAAISDIEKRKSDFDLDLAKVVTSDPILESLSKILDGKVGSPFSIEESKNLIEEFSRRVENGIPPGFEDARKPENAHGDFFVWEQLLREAEKRQTSVLFVTNDAKQDWVRKQAGLTVGPRPELVSEFRDRCGTDFLLSNLGHFLNVAKEKLGVSVSASTVAQAESANRRIKVVGEEERVFSFDELDIILSEVTSRIDDLDLTRRDPDASSKTHRIAIEEQRFAEGVLDALQEGRESEDGSFIAFLDARQWDYVNYGMRRGLNKSSAKESRLRRLTPSQVGALQQDSRRLRAQLGRSIGHRDYLQQRLAEAEAREESVERGKIENELMQAEETVHRLQAQAESIEKSLRDTYRRREAGGEV